MIEIRKKNDVEEETGKHQLFIDGSIVEGVQVDNLLGDDSDPHYQIHAGTDEATEKLTTQPFSEFVGKNVFALRLKYSVDWLEVLHMVWVQSYRGELPYSIFLMCNRVSLWRREYSFAEYFDQLLRLIKESKDTEIAVDDTSVIFEALMPMESFVFSFKSDQLELPLSDVITRCSNVLRTFSEQVEKALGSRIYSNSVVMSFDFPEEVRVPCEQYLLYFVQFLKDLGVEATAELQHKAGQVLFAVTPTDKQMALDKIRTALETYLQLATNPVNDTSIVEYEIAAQRLAANVDHLKGQLRLAHAELRLAEATIQTQQVSINNLLSGQVVIDSIKDVTPKPKEVDKEELLDGTVALTKVNWKGVEFNLPEIFRRLRRLFTEDE